jgi:dienelactone hydrolase
MPEGFESGEFTYQGVTRQVFRRGSEGPLVVVMPEIPGVTPTVSAFARRVADEGFAVAVPNLYGIPDKPPSPLYLASSLMEACISKEFKIFARHEASPVTDWIRALCRSLREQLGGCKVGAVGMCLSGNFALALMMDDWMLAPVLSQPSLPVAMSQSGRASLHMSPEQLAAAKKHCQQDGARILAMRFTKDPMCPGERFETLRREFGEAFEGIEIDSSRGNPHGIRRLAHSVVTEDLVDEAGHPTQRALHRVISFLKEQLQSPDGAKLNNTSLKYDK